MEGILKNLSQAHTGSSTVGMKKDFLRLCTSLGRLKALLPEFNYGIFRKPNRYPYYPSFRGRQTSRLPLLETGT
jgi:hypothetical protein